MSPEDMQRFHPGGYIPGPVQPVSLDADECLIRAADFHAGRLVCYRSSHTGRHCQTLQRYDIEAMPTADGPTEMWLGCLRCDWHAVYGGAPTLAELVQRAEEHGEVCR